MLTDFEIVNRKLFLKAQAIQLLLADGKTNEAMEEVARMAKLLVGEESLRKSERKGDGSSSLYH